MTDKIPLILWSGGLDSTSCLLRHASAGNKVDVAYVDLDNNYAKSKRERLARVQLRKLIHSEYGRIIQGSYKFKIGTMLAPYINVTLPQSYCWLFVSNMLFDSTRHSHIELGYVRGDDIWHVISHIKEANDAIGRAYRDGDVVPIEYPLEWNTKSSLISDIKEFQIGQDVLNTITYCERGDVDPRPCGKCTPCVNMEAAVFINSIGDKADLVEETK